MPDYPWDVVDIVNIDVPVEDGDVSETESLGSNTLIKVKPSALGACLVLGNVYYSNIQLCTQQPIVWGCLVGRDSS